MTIIQALHQAPQISASDKQKQLCPVSTVIAKETNQPIARTIDDAQDIQTGTQLQMSRDTNVVLGNAAQ